MGQEEGARVDDLDGALGARQSVNARTYAGIGPRADHIADLEEMVDHAPLTQQALHADYHAAAVRVVFRTRLVPPSRVSFFLWQGGLLAAAAG